MRSPTKPLSKSTEEPSNFLSTHPTDNPREDNTSLPNYTPSDSNRAEPTHLPYLPSSDQPPEEPTSLLVTETNIHSPSGNISSLSSQITSDNPMVEPISAPTSTLSHSTSWDISPLPQKKHKMKPLTLSPQHKSPHISHQHPLWILLLLSVFSPVTFQVLVTVTFQVLVPQIYYSLLFHI